MAALASQFRNMVSTPCSVEAKSVGSTRANVSAGIAMKVCSIRIPKLDFPPSIAYSIAWVSISSGLRCCSVGGNVTAGNANLFMAFFVLKIRSRCVSVVAVLPVRGPDVGLVEVSFRGSFVEVALDKIEAVVVTFISVCKCDGAAAREASPFVCI